MFITENDLNWEKCIGFMLMVLVQYLTGMVYGLFVRKHCMLCRSIALSIGKRLYQSQWRLFVRKPRVLCEPFALSIRKSLYRSQRSLNLNMY